MLVDLKQDYNTHVQLGNKSALKNFQLKLSIRQPDCPGFPQMCTFNFHWSQWKLCTLKDKLLSCV